MPLTPRQRVQAASIWGPTWREQHGEERIDEILNHIPPYHWIQRSVDEFERDHPAPAAEIGPVTSQTVRWDELTRHVSQIAEQVLATPVDGEAVRLEEQLMEEWEPEDNGEDDPDEEEGPFPYPPIATTQATHTEMTALEKQTRAVDIKMAAYRGGINHCRYGGTLANDKELAASAGYGGEDAKAYAEGFKDGFTTEKGIIEEKEKKNPTIKPTIKKKMVASKSPLETRTYTWANTATTENRF